MNDVQEAHLVQSGGWSCLQCVSSCLKCAGLRTEGKSYVALEPMTAPTNALTTGNGRRIQGGVPYSCIVKR